MTAPSKSRRKLWIAAALVALLAAVAYHQQSQLIGIAARWHLQRVSSAEEKTGDLTQRRRTIRRIHRQLLMDPPPDALVPELYDLVTLASARVATGEISLNWSAYIYTSHYRTLALERPSGEPRASREELGKYVQQQVEFYYLRKRPDSEGIRLDDLIGDGAGESYTVEEIEEAHRQGRDLTLE